MNTNTNKIYYQGEYRQFFPYIYHNGVWTLANTNIYAGDKWVEIPNWETFVDFKPAVKNITRSSAYSQWYEIDHLVDGDWAATNAWASARDVDFAWITVDFIYPVRNLIVYIRNRKKTGGQYPLVNGPTTGRIEGSNDKKTWTTLCSISGRKGGESAAGEQTQHLCNKSDDAYRYIRLYFTSWAGKDYTYDNFCAVGEIAFAGERSLISS